MASGGIGISCISNREGEEASQLLSKEMYNKLLVQASRRVDRSAGSPPCKEDSKVSI
jgi:hypothetical protein